ncbi:MAG TPA: ATP-binding cassette domain-containing protein [Verrucomicrobiae bacterium]|jgi:ATP-binding cassette subfamily B protein
MTFFQYLRVLARYLSPYRSIATGVGALLMVDVAFSIMWPLGLKYFIDKISAGVDLIFFSKIAGALILAVLLASGADLLRGYGFAVLSTRIKRDARQAVFRHLQQMSMSFFMQQRSRDLIARLSGDLVLLESAVTSGAAGFLLGAVGIVCSVTILFFLEWRLAALTVCALVLCVELPRPLVKVAADARVPVEDKESELEHIAQQTVLAQPVVKAFGLGPHFINGFVDLTESLTRETAKAKFIAYVLERSPNLIILIAEVLVMGLGLLMVARGHRTLGTIVAFQGIFLYVVRSIQTLTQVTPVLMESVLGLGRVQELLKEEAAVSDQPGAADHPPMRENIRFHNVSFSYGGGLQNLHGIDLTIRCGTFVAFVGSSGSGKSTLFNLIVRFYDPNAGSIMFDGVDIRQTMVESLRRQMGVVFQDSDLFHLSLRENIRLGFPSASDDEVEGAARQAEIHEWIASLPKGYDTLAGECGGRLSGGQRQRIAIARALLRHPRILLLDEATSALDPETEAAINATLRDLSAGRTVISVTHRLASVQNADCIYFMQGGRVAEAGSHANLMAARGAYARLWRRQSGFTINEQGDDGVIDPAHLQDYPVMSELEPEALAEAVQYFVAESYPAAQDVVTEGEMGDKFYLIARGKVEILKQNGAEEPKRIAVLDDGDYFGEIALLHRMPRTATVRTLAPTLLLSLRDTHFQALIKHYPKLETRFRAMEARSRQTAEAASD